MFRINIVSQKIKLEKIVKVLTAFQHGKANNSINPEMVALSFA